MPAALGTAQRGAASHSPSPLRRRRAALLLPDSLIRIRLAAGRSQQAWALTRCSGHSPEGSCFALPEPAPAPHMCGAPAEPGMARPGRGSAPSPPPLSICCAQQAASYGRVTYVCGARARAGMTRQGRQGEAWCPPPAAKHPLGSIIRTTAATCVGLLPRHIKKKKKKKRVCTPAIALHAHAMGRHSPGLATPMFSATPVLLFPPIPPGEQHSRSVLWTSGRAMLLCSLPKLIS